MFCLCSMLFTAIKYIRKSPMGQVAMSFWLVPDKVVSHLALSCFGGRIVFFSRAQPHGRRKKVSPSTFRDSSGQILIFHDISTTQKVLNWREECQMFLSPNEKLPPTIQKPEAWCINFPASPVFQHFRSNEAFQNQRVNFKSFGLKMAPNLGFLRIFGSLIHFMTTGFQVALVSHLIRASEIPWWIHNGILVLVWKLEVNALYICCHMYNIYIYV